VSKAQVIARLEALLERVKTRAAGPRAPAAVAAVAASRAPEIVAAVAAAELQQEPVIAVSIVEEVVPGDGLESRERLVAAEPLPEPVAESPQEPDIDLTSEAEPLPPSGPPRAMEEAVEPAPISSRRPVAPEPQERLAEIAFGAEEPQPPRHTPPPESGRLPSAPEADYDLDVTGVREAAAVVPRLAEEPDATEVSARVRVDQPVAPRELVPQVTRPQLASSDAVADVIVDAQRFTPPTFLALLDASLAL